MADIHLAITAGATCTFAQPDALKVHVHVHVQYTSTGMYTYNTHIDSKRSSSSLQFFEWMPPVNRHHTNDSIFMGVTQVFRMHI